MRGVAVFDVFRDGSDVCRRVGNECAFFVFGHEPIKGARLVKAVVRRIVVRAVVVDTSVGFGVRRAHAGVAFPLAETVREIAFGRSGVPVDAHLSVAVVRVHGATRAVDGNLVVIYAEAVTLGVAVGKEAALQKFVRRKSDSGNDMRGRERGLFDIGEVVFRIAVEFEHADFDERKFLVAPRFGDVEGIFFVIFCLFFRHDLEKQFPTREVFSLNRFKQIPLVAFAVPRDDCCGFFVGQIFDSLLRDEMKFDPRARSRGVYEAERVAAESVHVAITCGNAAVRHHDCNLMKRFGKHCPKIPVVLRRAEVGFRVAFDGVIQVRKLERVANEKHRSVVPDQVPVAFLRVKFNRETANVALGVCRAAFSGNGGKAHENVGLLSDFGKQLGASVARDVVRRRKRAERAASLGVHATLGNDFAVEVREFFHEPDVLHHDGTARSGGLRVAIVGDGGADFVREFFGRNFHLQRKRRRLKLCVGEFAV